MILDRFDPTSLVIESGMRAQNRFTLLLIPL